MAITTLGALFPIFALIWLGWLCGRRGWLGENGDDVLNAFVGKIALPVLTFQVLATMKAGDLAEPVMFTAVVGASWLLFLAHFLFEKMRGLDSARANIAALGASYGNSAFVGLPICLALLGPASLAPSAVVMALNTTFIFGGGAVTSALASGAGGAVRERLTGALWLVAGNPLVIGAVAGVGIAISGYTLPAPVDVLLRSLGSVTAPCALVAVGMFIARPVPAAAGTGATWRGIAGKLVLLPVITAAILWSLPPVPPVWRDTALIMAGAPVASSCFILASGGGEATLRLASRLIVLSTLGAAITLPLLLLLLKPGG